MLLKTIKDDLLTARKARDKLEIKVLMSLLADAAKVGKDNGNRESTDEEVVAVVKKFLKSIDETMALGDVIMNALLEVEREVVARYLPPQLSENDIRKFVCGFLVDHVEDEISVKLLGSIMGWLKRTYPGQYDGKMASEVIKDMLLRHSLEVCPDCKLLSVAAQPSGGVKCLNPDCDYWECL